jgi:hypothetical protein
LGFGLVYGEVLALLPSERGVVHGHLQDGAEVGFGDVIASEFGGGEAGVKEGLGAVFAGSFFSEEGGEGSNGGFEIISFVILISEHEGGPIVVGVFWGIDDGPHDDGEVFGAL